MAQHILHLQFKIFRMKNIIVIILTTFFGSFINAQVIPIGFIKPPPVNVTVGQSYGGGIVAYIFTSSDPGYVAGQTHGLIAATSDLYNGNKIKWNNGTNIFTNATETAIGKGLVNTNMIITTQGNNGVYAAKICKDYRGGGFNDWYLPSINELRKLSQNRLSIGGFKNHYYWSSTETNQSLAVDLLITDPIYVGSYNKEVADDYVRAIRSF